MSMSPHTLRRTLALLKELKPQIDARARVWRALAPTQAGREATRRAMAGRRSTTILR